jgi:hypothetical protein
VPASYSSESQTGALRGQLQGQLEGMARVYVQRYSAGPIVSNDDGGMTMVNPEDVAWNCCGDVESNRRLPSEFQDKVGSYHGFSTAVTVGWLHALKTRAILPWPGLPLPTAESIRKWTPVTIPIDIMRRIAAERLPIAPAFLAGINLAAASLAIDLLEHAPARPADAELGRPEPPIGQLHHIDETGGLFSDAVRSQRLPVPPVAVAGADWADTHVLVVAPQNVRSFKADLRLPHRRDGNWVVIDVWLAPLASTVRQGAYGSGPGDQLVPGISRMSAPHTAVVSAITADYEVLFASLQVVPVFAVLGYVVRNDLVALTETRRPRGDPVATTVGLPLKRQPPMVHGSVKSGAI